ncbi:hypothetical protein PVK06_046835 [Gossypium arboreum]|uniref:Reverse transcriptase n=1 Tax=Gossypium arboreum TaxID=29729 RepID=A0ABR0MBP7_GOSAR|nr:hypothetical protein PVK06_046835 [Gossypium arboreum]
MKISSWNVRGLGQSRRVNCLKNKVRYIQPQILFLMEIKVDRRRMEKIRRKCGFDYGIDVDAEGTRGGLSLGWRDDWLLDKKLEEQIQQGLSINETNTLRKLSGLGDRLSKWAKKEKGVRERRIRDLNSKKLKLSAKEINNEVLAEMTEIKLEMNLEADRKELFWEQRARANWLQMGDRNTSFFHSWTTYRRKKNIIKGLETVSGRWVTEVNEISNIATNYLKDLFLTREVANSDNLISTITPCIIEELNENLKKEFQAEEILKAIKSIAPLKALGNDGFSAIFFQKYWNIMGEEITRYCLQILNGQQNMEEVNRTSIVLIPKKRRGGSNRGFALKLDMSKAYARVEWSFVESLMRRMGFCEDLISLIMRCITSVTYTVVTNGKNGEEFRPTRGLSILFGEASLEGANILKGVINEYETLSGQKVNFEKYLIYFNGNVEEELKEQVSNILGVRITNNPEKYLGLPTTVGQKKKQAFIEIKEGFNKLINNWSIRFLSAGGNEKKKKLLKLQGIRPLHE